MSKRPVPNFKSARYVDIQKHWRRLKPFYHSTTAARIWKPCMLEYLKWRREDHGFDKPITLADHHDFPWKYDSCDWRWCYGRKGPQPAFWQFVCHSACHWLVDLNLFVAGSAWHDQPWRILTSRKHSMVWNGDYRQPVLFDANFNALDVTPCEALELAWHGRKLRVGYYLKGYLHKGGG